MAIGDVTARLDSADLIGSTWIYTGGAVRLSNGYFAMIFRDAAGNGYVYTFPVDTAGQIGAAIDAWKFGSTIPMVSFNGDNFYNLSGDIYAICFENSTAQTFTVYTLTISSVGVITKAIVDEDSEHMPSANYIGGASARHGTNNCFVAAKHDTDFDGRVATIICDSDGTNVTGVDNWEFNTDKAANPTITHVNNDIFVLGYYVTSGRGTIATFSVASDGTITKSLIDTQVVGSVVDGAEIFDIVRLSNTLIAVLFQDSSLDGRIEIFSIDGSGNISAALSQLEYELVQANSITALYLGQDSGSFHYVMATVNDSNFDMNLFVFKIANDGTTCTLHDNINHFVTSVIAGQRVNILVHDDAASSVYIVLWTSTGNPAIWASTVGVEKEDASGDNTSIRVTSLTHLYNRGVYNLTLGLGEVVADSEIVSVPDSKDTEYSKPLIQFGPDQFQQQYDLIGNRAPVDKPLIPFGPEQFQQAEGITPKMVFYPPPKPLPREKLFPAVSDATTSLMDMSAGPLIDLITPGQQEPQTAKEKRQARRAARKEERKRHRGWIKDLLGIGKNR